MASEGVVSKIVSAVEDLLIAESTWRQCEVCGQQFGRLQFDRPEKDLCRDHWEEEKPPRFVDYYPPREYWRAVDEIGEDELERRLGHDMDLEVEDAE